MEKVYTYSIPYKALTLVLLLIVIGFSFVMSEAVEIVFALILVAFFVWLTLYIFKFRIIITEQRLIKDAGRLSKRVECGWNQIIRISKEPGVRLFVYKIESEENLPIIIPDTMDTYMDLLRDIIERSPNAIVDDSTWKLLYNNRDTRYQEPGNFLQRYPYFGLFIASLFVMILYFGFLIFEK